MSVDDAAREQATGDTSAIGSARMLTAVIDVPGGDGYIHSRACLRGPDPSIQQRGRTVLSTVRWF